MGGGRMSRGGVSPEASQNSAKVKTPLAKLKAQSPPSQYADGEIENDFSFCFNSEIISLLNSARISGVQRRRRSLGKIGTPFLTLGNGTHRGGDDNSMKRAWNFCTKDQKRGGGTGGGTETFFLSLLYPTTHITLVELGIPHLPLMLP